jgi:hypothetical protein
MRKGIVIEVNDPYLTMLTPDGEFMRAKKLDRVYSIGEELDFFPVAVSGSSKRKYSFWNLFTLKTVGLALAVLIIFAGSLIPMYQSNQAYAYMTIGTGASIEMGLNKNMEVVELKGFNKEANQMISQLQDWKKKDASEITTMILAEMKDEGYIAQAEPIIISTVKTKQMKGKAEAKLQKSIKKIKKTIADNRVEIKTYTTTEAELEKARNSGVSVGTYHESKNASPENKKGKEKMQPTKVEKIDHKKNTSTESNANAAVPSDSKEVLIDEKKQNDVGNRAANGPAKGLENKGDKSLSEGQVKKQSVNENKVKNVDTLKTNNQNKTKNQNSGNK